MLRALYNQCFASKTTELTLIVRFNYFDHFMLFTIIPLSLYFRAQP